jgi:hypothetical protein
MRMRSQLTSVWNADVTSPAGAAAASAGTATPSAGPRRSLDHGVRALPRRSHTVPSSHYQVTPKWSTLRIRATAANRPGCQRWRKQQPRRRRQRRRYRQQLFFRGARGHIRGQGRWPPQRDAALIPEPIPTTAAPVFDLLPLVH